MTSKDTSDVPSKEKLAELTTVANLQPADPDLQAMVDQLVALVAAGRRGAAIELLTRAGPIQNGTLSTTVDDLITALSEAN